MATITEKLIFRIPLKMKEDWKKFAESKKQTLSSIIRYSVNKYIKDDEKEITFIKVNHLEEEIQKLKAELEEVNKEINKEIDPNEINHALSEQILNNLRNIPNGLTEKQLAQNCASNKILILNSIASLQSEKSIIKDLMTNQWRLN